jgi:hypothetical protein
MKNHVNGIQFGDGKIMVTPHGFMRAKEAAEEKKSREDYVKDNLLYISSLFDEKVDNLEEIKFEPIREEDNED